MSYAYRIRALPNLVNGPHIFGSSSPVTNDTQILELWAGPTNTSRTWTWNAGGDQIPEDVLATTATRGFLYIPGSNGVPTGVPANAASGIVPLCYDYANNDLYAYNGGWVKVSLS